MEFPVLIIGTGPSGATTALHLARLGVKSLFISRHRGSANTPRAHIFNQKAMEVLRDADLEEQLAQIASPVHDMQHTSWLHNLAGEEYGRLWAWGNKPTEKGEYERASPCIMSDLPQSVLEPILVAEAVKLGAEIRFNTEFVSFEETPDGISTTLRDRATTKTYEIHSKYLVGADGARSQVLDALKIPIVGKQLNTAFNVHVKADLTKYIPHRPGILNWILNPDAPDWSAVGNFRMVRPWTEFVVSLHPATKDGKPFDPTPDATIKRLYQMIGDDSIPIEILSSFQWTINDQVAERWQQGRVICIGDDAFNMAWKLAYVVRGFASHALLDTITSERKPVGDAIVKRANAGMEAHRQLWDLMGLTPAAREQIVQKLASATSEGAELRVRLRDALEAIDDEVQALGIQMNQLYVGSPSTVIKNGDKAPDFSTLNFIKDIMISTFPGFHLPHVWLAANGQAERVSSLDLAGKGHFTLFTGIGGGSWLEAAKRISKQEGVQVKGCSIGFRCDYMDCYREWIRVRGVEETGVVLVRPDHFVAWRCESVADDCYENLNSVICKILGNPIEYK